MAAKLRFFVAIPLSRAVEEGVGGVLAGVSKYREVRWVSKAQLHITLLFIGAMEETLVPRLEEELWKISGLAESFDVEIGGIEAFPRLDRPKVLFIPVIRGQEGFQKLKRALTNSLEGFGVEPEEKEYHPHLTLGRVKEKDDAKAAVETLQKTCPAHWEPWRADRFVLFKSQLTSNGSIYTRLREFEFGKS